jgi:hypothetical protein
MTGSASQADCFLLKRAGHHDSAERGGDHDPIIPSHVWHRRTNGGIPEFRCTFSDRTRGGHQTAHASASHSSKSSHGRKSNQYVVQSQRKKRTLTLTTAIPLHISITRETAITADSFSDEEEDETPRKKVHNNV